MKSSFILLIVSFVLVVSCKDNPVAKKDVITLAETIQSWNGDTLPAYPEGQPKVTILKITIPPKSKLKTLGLFMIWKKPFTLK